MTLATKERSGQNVMSDCAVGSFIVKSLGLSLHSFGAYVFTIIDIFKLYLFGIFVGVINGSFQGLPLPYNIENPPAAGCYLRITALSGSCMKHQTVFINRVQACDLITGFILARVPFARQNHTAAIFPIKLNRFFIQPLFGN